MNKNTRRLVGDKTVLVTGPPGTGKSVIALFRAANVQQLGNDRNPVLLTFGKLLTLWTQKALVEACEALDADADRVTVKTVDAWFGGNPRNPTSGWFYKTFGEPVPRYWEEPSNYKPINWDAAYDIAASAVSEGPHLIVDEAQDLHQNFWQIVLPYCRSCTIFCDTNQTLRDDAGEHFSVRFRRHTRNRRGRRRTPGEVEYTTQFREHRICCERGMPSAGDGKGRPR